MSGSKAEAKAQQDMDAAAAEMAQAKAAEAAAAAPPITFHAPDRYHAMTYVAQSLYQVPGAVKAAMTAALNGMSHLGPVHVDAPARPARPGTPEPDANAPEDPTHPKDGAFAIEPYEFVKV
jgi:hypothetical protein